MTTPFFSLIVVLTEKNFYLLSFTLDSFVHTSGSREVILVDGTNGKVNLAHLPIEGVKIIQSKGESTPAKLNRALKVCTGSYVHVLYPGEFYIWNEALKFMQKMIQGYHFPDLIYTPRRVRHRFGMATTDFFPLSTKILTRGDIPWSVQSCFFRREALVMMGGFSEKYKIRWGYELLCRFFRAPTLTKVYVKRLLTDYEYRRPPTDWLWKDSVQTARISLKYFGPSLQLIMWMVQNCVRVFLFGWKLLRSAVMNRRYVS